MVCPLQEPEPYLVDKHSQQGVLFNEAQISAGLLSQYVVQNINSWQFKTTLYYSCFPYVQY